MNWLKSQSDCQAVKIHGDQYNINEADIIGCCRGMFFAFEVKRPGKVPRPAQQARLRQWRGAGAFVAAPQSLEDAQRVIDEMRRSSAVQD